MSPFVITSEAKQSTWPGDGTGLLRRHASRNDGNERGQVP